MSHIKFEHSDSGNLEFHNTSILNDLFAIGAVYLTRKRTLTSSDQIKVEYATDDKGLEDLIYRNDEILTSLHTSLSTLGILQAYVNSDDIESHVLNDLGWMIHNLSELAAAVSFCNSEMNYHLSTKKAPK